jgi:sulfide:quinone oxidoreductase
MKRIAILGAGFAALKAVSSLRARDKNIQITVISPESEFVYYPSLIWIPSGARQASDIVAPLGRFFQRMAVTHRVATVTGLDTGRRCVLTDDGEVEYDGLIIACGSRYIKKLPGLEHACIPCEGTTESEAVRDRLESMDAGVIAVGFGGNPKEPSAVRGGPMFEFLFGMHNQLRREGRRDRFKIVFFNPMTEPGKRLGSKAVKGLVDTMKNRGIETHLGHKIKGFETNKVLTEGGDIPADLILFTPGMTGLPWFVDSDLPLSAGGMIQSDAYCRVSGLEGVYVAGDAGSFPGPEWMPKQAHSAELQATAAAINLLSEMSGGNTDKTFRAELVCVVDDLDSGMLVARTPSFSLVLPPMRALHWSKTFLEWRCLRKYRN